MDQVRSSLNRPDLTHETNNKSVLVKSQAQTPIDKTPTKKAEEVYQTSSYKKVFKIKEGRAESSLNGREE
jgi:hypothetical protein